MASLGDMVVRIRGDMTDFNKAIDSSEKQFKATAANFQKIGANMTKFVTVPLLAAGAGFLKLADTQVQAEAALANAIRATGKEATISVANLSKFAGELQKVTKFGDEAQLSALALVQQLADLNEDGLKAVLPGILNFSTAMGVDLQTAASLVGKTLGSSTNALARYGVEVDATAGPTEKLAQLTEALEKRFGGAAEAAAKAGLGPLVQLKNSAGDLGEEFGKILIPGVIKLADGLKSVVESLQALDPATKTAIVQYGLLAAAIGPVILGVLQLIKILPQLKLAFAFLAANPVILGITALGAAIAVVAIESKKAATQAKAMQDALSGAADLEAMQTALRIKRQEIEYQQKLIQQNENLGNQGRLAAASAKQALTALQSQAAQISVNIANRRTEIQATEAQNALATRLAEAELEKAKLQQANAEAKRVNDENEAKRIADQLAASEALIASLRVEMDEYKTSRAGMEAAAQELMDMELGIIAAVARGRKKADDERKAREVEWQALYKLGLTQTLNGFADIGAAAVDGELSWKTFAKAALNSLASVLDALGAQLAALAAIAFFGFPPRPTAGVGNSLGAAAAFTAAGAVRASAVALADGGVVMPKPGGTLAQIAEAGQPEAVIPLDKLGEMGGDIHLTVTLDSRPFLEKIFPATRNRQILISAGAVV